MTVSYLNATLLIVIAANNRYENSFPVAWQFKGLCLFTPSSQQLDNEYIVKITLHWFSVLVKTDFWIDL